MNKYLYIYFYYIYIYNYIYIYIFKGLRLTAGRRQRNGRKAVLGACCAQVEAMYGGDILDHPGLKGYAPALRPILGPCWAYVGPMLAYVSPSLA